MDKKSSSTSCTGNKTQSICPCSVNLMIPDRQKTVSHGRHFKHVDFVRVGSPDVCCYRFQASVTTESGGSGNSAALFPCLTQTVRRSGPVLVKTMAYVPSGFSAAT